MLQWLADNPDALAHLADPESISLAVEEFLRHSSPIQIFGRNATKDMCLHGRDLSAGDIVALGFGAANHDPAVFESPEEMRLDRRPNRHLTFGAGPHLCAGASVARMEMTATLRMLIEAGVTFQLDPNTSPRLKTRGDRHGLASLPLLVGKKTNRP
jgi:cytochrome P450